MHGTVRIQLYQGVTLFQAAMWHYLNNHKVIRRSVKYLVTANFFALAAKSGSLQTRSGGPPLPSLESNLILPSNFPV